MATTPNYGWVTPAPTDFVTDLPADFETFADAVDASFTATEGDLLVGNASDIFVPLNIGAVDTVLTSDGTTATWAAPGSPIVASNWSLLNAGGTALTGASTVTVSGISGKDKIMILVEEASSSTLSAFINLNINSDTGANYTAHGAEYVTQPSYTSATPSRRSKVNQTTLQLCRMANDAANYVSAAIFLSGCNSSGVKAFQTQAGGTNIYGGSGQQAYWLGGFWNNSATVTSISISASVGNLDGGTVFVYTSVS